MIVAVAASAAAVTPPSELAAAPPPADWNAAAATARPARLDRAIWPKAPPSPAREAAGAAAKLVGSTEASVLIPGAASVQPCGTDMLPTRAALPMAPDTGAPPKPAELKCAGSPPLVSGANAPAGRMYVGPGPGPLLAAAAAWDELAAELQSTAASYGSTIQGLTAGPWTGPSSIAMAAAAAPYVSWISATGAQAEQAASQAKIAAGAYETAFAATVPPPVIATNRALLMTLIATNFLGQNTHVRSSGTPTADGFRGAKGGEGLPVLAVGVYLAERQDRARR